jgi:hypothetical protein
MHTYICIYIYIHTYMAKTQREPLKDTSVNCLKAEPWMGWGHVFSIQPWFHDTLPGFELQMGGLLRLFSWVSLRHLRSKKFQGYVLCYRSFTRVRFLIMAFSLDRNLGWKWDATPLFGQEGARQLDHRKHGSNAGASKSLLGIQHLG